MNEYELWQTPDWQRKAGFAAPGDKVVFLDRGGWSGELESARDAGLVKDGIYIVESTTIHRSSSDYKLLDFKNHFNTVMFKVVKDEVPMTRINELTSSIADLFNHGLNDLEIARQTNCTSEELIAVCRNLMK